MTEQRLSEQLATALELSVKQSDESHLTMRYEYAWQTIYYAAGRLLPALQELEAERERLRTALADVEKSVCQDCAMHMHSTLQAEATRAAQLSCLEATGCSAVFRAEAAEAALERRLSQYKRYVQEFTASSDQGERDEPWVQTLRGKVIAYEYVIEGLEEIRRALSRTQEAASEEK